MLQDSRPPPPWHRECERHAVGRLELDDIRTVGLWAMDCDFVLLQSQPPVSPSLANTLAQRTATIEEGIPAMLFGVSVVTLYLVITFASSRAEASVGPPASVPQITGADT